MPANTANQALRLPISTDDPDVVDDLTQLVAQIEPRLVMKFTSVSDRTTRVPSPTAGMLAIMNDTSTVVFYNGSTWVTIYPAVFPSITAGSSVPSNSSGANGDIFFKV